MRWMGERESNNVDDRRGFSTGKGVAVGGGAIAVIFLIIKLLLGGGDSATTQELIFPGASHEMTAEEQAADNERAKFVKVVLGYTEDVWNDIFSNQGYSYRYPTLVLFRDNVQSACGFASAA